MNIDELLTATDKPIWAVGHSHYFVPQTLQLGEKAGLDPFQFYFLGRGGVLGDVEAPVVVSAFGYFAPDVVTTMWDSARAILPPRDGARLHLRGGHEFARERFAEVPGLDAFCAAAEEVVATVEPAGLALFAGFAAEPVPADAPARALQLSVVLRELRGSAHLLSVVASGLRPLVAHALRRPDDIALFGWQPDQAPEVREADRARLDAADRLTHDLLAVPYGVLDEAGRRSLCEGAEAMAAALPT